MLEIRLKHEEHEKSVVINNTMMSNTSIRTFNSHLSSKFKMQRFKDKGKGKGFKVNPLLEASILSGRSGIFT